MIAMEKTVRNFPKRAAHICTLGYIRDFLEYFGFPISEPMCYGMAGGYGFTYRRDEELLRRGMEAPEHQICFQTSPISGHRPDYLAKALDFLNLEIISHHSSDPDAGWRAVAEMVDRNIPVPLRVDRYYLSVFKDHQRSHRVHHWLVLLGYSLRHGEALVYSNVPFFCGQIPLDALRLARNSEHLGEEEKNEWWEFRLPDRSAEITRGGLRDKIISAFRYMTGQEDSCGTGPLSFAGIAGIRQFANDLERLIQAESTDSLSDPIAKLHYCMTFPGGPMVASSLFSLFLVEAAEMLDSQKLYKLAARYKELSTEWRVASGMLLKAKLTRSGQLLSRVAPRLLGLADREEKLLNDLYDLFR